MKSYQVGLGTLLVAGVCMATFSASAYYCPIPIYSVYENTFPDFMLTEESVLSLGKQISLECKEVKYTEALGERKGGKLKPVPGVKRKENEIIFEMKDGAGNGTNIIANSKTPIEGIDDLADYSVAQGQIKERLTVRPFAERNGKNYTTAEMNKILENQRTAVNDLAANAIGMGATETVNAAVAAESSGPEKRAKEIAKAKTLAHLYELMLGMDRRIYERSLHVSAVEATNASVEALRILTGASTTSSGQ